MVSPELRTAGSKLMGKVNFKLVKIEKSTLEYQEIKKGD